VLTCAFLQPFLIVADPRRTSVGHAAVENGGIHLPARVGTNLCLLNGILKILLDNDEFHDSDFICASSFPAPPPRSRSSSHLSRSPLRPLTPLAPLAAKHTIGIDALRETVKDYPVERVAEITGVDAELIQRAAEKIGRSKRHVSTCLQGV
jgi:anaerobic selenocysteine-containing dehydrogenase